MKYFKDKDNKVFAYAEDGSEDDFIQDGLVEITVDAANIIINPPFTPEQEMKKISISIQNHLDTKAQSLRYDNINAIGKYVGYVNDFQAEAEALGAWASSCWKVAGQIEADVQSGVRVMPTVDEVLAELPVYV